MIGRGATRAAPFMAAAGSLAGIPAIGAVGNAIMLAEQRIGRGNGKDKLALAMESLSVAAPYILHDIEHQFGLALDDDEAESYIQDLVELHVKHFNRKGVLPK